MSNKKSACDTPNAASTNQNITNPIISSATEKIKTCEAKNIKSAKGQAIFQPVQNMLTEFCNQQEEFARAVAAVDDLEKIINEVGKGLPNAVSDLDVYQQVVEKIFPGARVTFTMQIHMSEYELEQPTEQEKAPVTLDLGNLIDW